MSRHFALLSIIVVVGLAAAAVGAPRQGALGRLPVGYAIEPSQSQIDGWQSPVNLTATSARFEYSQYGHCRGVAVDTAGNVHVTWYTPVAVTKVCYRKWTRATQTWGAVETVSTSTSLNSYRGGIAVDNSGNVHVVWMRNQSPNCGIWYRRKDAASGLWNAESRIVTKYASSAPGEPSIVARPGGNQVHVVWTQRCSTGVNPTLPKVWHREYDGSTWGPTTMVSIDTSTVALYAGVAVDTSDNVHVSWSQYGDGSPNYRIWYRARVGGAWQDREAVSSPDMSSQSQYNPDIEVSPGGTPHIAWHGRTVPAPTHFRILYRNRAGGSWSSVETVSVYNSEHNDYPCLALAGDTIHIAWRRDNTGSPVYSHIRYRRHLLTGEWDSDVKLTPEGWTSTAYYSTIAADRGDVHLVWYDTWNGSAAVYNDVWYLRRPVDPDVDYEVVSIDSIWPYVAKAGSAKIAATIRNSGRLNQPVGKRVILEVDGPGGYTYCDTALTTVGLVPGDSAAVVFAPDWATPDTRGIYRVTVISDLDGDLDPSNDTCRRTVEVYPGLYETYTGTAFPPTGWLSYNFDQSDPWRRLTDYSYTAPACAMVRFDTPNNDWLITPKLGPIDSGDDSLIFMFRADEGNYYETLTVKLSTSSQTDTAAFTTVLGRYVTTNDTTWHRLAWDLAAYRDSIITLAFVYKNYDAFGVAVDDVMGPKVYVPLLDVALESAHGETYPLVVGTDETLVALARNRGRNATGPFKAYLVIDGGLFDSTDVANLVPGDSAALQFVLNPSTSRRARFAFYSALAGDETPVNDTVRFDDWVFPRNTYAAEGFDQPQTVSFPPQGWARLNLDGGAHQWEWRAETAHEHSGQQHAGVRWESPALRNNDWLVTGPVTPSATGTDSMGFFWRAYDTGYPESLEVYVMSGQSAPTDTIARIFAEQTAATGYLERKLCLDDWDDQPVYFGFRYPSLDRYWLLLDDVWWQRTLGGPAAPILVSPPDQADSQPYAGTLTWHPAFNADVYDVWLDTVSPPAVLIAGGITDTTADYAGLLPWHRYYWRVDARNLAGRTVSHVWTFTTIGPDTTPPAPPGWLEVGQVPLAPSGRAVKDGGAIAYDRGSEAYLVLKGYKTGDFYEFRPELDAWTPLAPMPLGVENKAPYKGANLCADGNGTVYATKGNNTTGFWKYVAAESAWTQLADVPLGISNKRVKGGTDLAYVDEGDSQYVYLLKGYKCEFYRYNVASGAWYTLADAPTGIKNKYDKGSWLALDDAGRRLYAHKAKYHELYAYSLDSLNWGPLLAGMPLANSQTGKSKKAKDGSDGAVIDRRIYASKGGNTQDFYVYDLATGAWAELETIPRVGSTLKKKKVKAGAGLTTDGVHLFGLKGNKTLEVWRYVPGRPGSSVRPGGWRSGVQAANPALPVAVHLRSPARGQATINWSLPSSGQLAIAVYDVTGRLVAQRNVAAAATGSVTLDLRRLAAGVYLVKLSSDSRSWTRKLVVER